MLTQTSSIKLINLILIGLTDVNYRNTASFHRQGEKHYFEREYINDCVTYGQFEEMYKFANQADQHIIIMKKFIKAHHRDCI